MPSAWLLSLALLLAGGDGRTLDHVELNNGVKLDGHIVFKDADTLVLREGSRDREISMSDVSIVHSRAANLREALERWDKVGPGDAAGTLDLARFCKRIELEDEARLFAWRMLALDPKNADAHEMLGHQRHGSAWSVRDGTRSFAFDKLADLRKEWIDAWKMSSTHYRMRSNLDLKSAVDTTLDLEGFYRSFFRLFGRELRLYEVIDPMACEVHADAKSYPELLGNRPAYFDPASNTLLINAANGLDRGALFHEATHQILHVTAVLTSKATGEIPGWLDEGLAEYMRAGVDGQSGHATFAPGLLHKVHFRAHATAKEPFSLNRVLNFQSDDFLASTKVELKYAQSYTLVHYCLHGENGKFRERFLEFVRGTYHGQASASRFKETLNEKAFEEGWIAYVKWMAR